MTERYDGAAMAPGDYYDIESLLSADERIARDTARRFVEEEYLPLIRDTFRQGDFPRQIIPRAWRPSVFSVLT
jgi:glutaryl-CoA dehydrogenase